MLTLATAFADKIQVRNCLNQFLTCDTVLELQEKNHKIAWFSKKSSESLCSMKFVIDKIRVLAVQRSPSSLNASCWMVMPTPWYWTQWIPCFSAYIMWPHSKDTTGESNALYSDFQPMCHNTLVCSKNFKNMQYLFSQRHWPLFPRICEICSQTLRLALFSLA